MVTKKEFTDLQDKVCKQEITINNWISKINLLEGKIIQISSEKEIASHIVYSFGRGSSKAQRIYKRC